MTVAVVSFLRPALMTSFYFMKDSPQNLARVYLSEGNYTPVSGHDVGDLIGEDAAEEMFDISNNPSREDEREAVFGRSRSISVGDIVTVDGVGYLCASMGWIRL